MTVYIGTDLGLTTYYSTYWCDECGHTCQGHQQHYYEPMASTFRKPYWSGSEVQGFDSVESLARAVYSALTSAELRKGITYETDDMVMGGDSYINESGEEVEIMGTYEMTDSLGVLYRHQMYDEFLVGVEELVRPPGGLSRHVRRKLRKAGGSPLPRWRGQSWKFRARLRKRLAREGVVFQFLE